MIRVRFFGKFSDLVSNPEGLLVESDGIETVSDIVAMIGRTDPRLYGDITAPQVMIAVNQSVAPVTTPVGDGDEVAFLPPVTGG